MNILERFYSYSCIFTQSSQYAQRTTIKCAYNPGICLGFVCKILDGWARYTVELVFRASIREIVHMNGEIAHNFSVNVLVGPGLIVFLGIFFGRAACFTWKIKVKLHILVRESVVVSYDLASDQPICNKLPVVQLK